MAFGFNPTIPLRDPANPSNYNVVGNGISGTSFNPVADIMLRTKNGKDQWLLADATVKINLMKGLSLQGTVGIDKRQYQEYTYVSHDHKESIDNSRRGGASHKFSKDSRVSVAAYANYHRVFREDHTLDVVAGYSFWQAGGEDFSMSNYDFPVDGSVRGIWAWVRTSRKGVPRWTRARTRANGCSRCSAAPTIRTGTATW